MAGKNAVVRVAVTLDNSALKRGLKESQARLAGLGKSVAKIGVAAGAAAGVGMAIFAKSTVDAASEAQQSIGATEGIYGKFAQSVIDSSNKAAEAVGLSADEYRTNANLLGALLKNQGVSQDQLGRKTSKLIKLGADLSAMYGGTATEAVEALTSAFKGEFDPVEKYGISIKQSTINTEAFRIAGVKSQAAFSKLSTAQQTAAKQQATTALLMKQSADAQGQFGKETDTLAHKQQVLAAQFQNAKVKIGNALLPVFTELTEYASTHLIPKLEDLGGWLDDHQDEFREWGQKVADTATELGDLAGTIGSEVLPVAKSLAETLADLVEWFNDLPGPIKRVTIEAGLAALAFYKFSPAVTGAVTSMKTGIPVLKQFYAELTYTETRGTALKGALSKLGPAARAAAGAGGLVALTEGAQTTNQGLKTLSDTAGGAMLGFSVGGPWGAAIGGGIGLLVSLKDAFKDTEQAARDAAREAGQKDAWDAASDGVKDLTDALHGTLKAYNDLSAAAVQKSFKDADGALLPWVQHLLDAGVSMDTLTRAALGQADAQKVLDKAQQNVNTNLAARKGAYEQAKKAVVDFNAAMAAQRDAGVLSMTPEQIKQQNALADAVKETKNQYEDYKAQVGEGNDALRRLTGTVTGHRAQMADLAKQLGISADQYKKFPKEVRTQIESTGLPQTMTQVKDLQRQYKLTPDQVKTLVKVIGGQQAKADAKRFGEDAGSSYGAGYTAGIAKWEGDAAHAAAAMAAAAHAAAMREQRSNSPSKKAMTLGKWYAQGYAIGVRQGWPEVKAAVTSGIASLFEHQENPATAYLRDVSSQISQLGSSLVQKAKDALKGKAETKAVSRINASVKSAQASVAAYGKQLAGVYAKWQSVNDQIDEQTQKLADLKQQATDYAAGIHDSFVALGDVSNFGKLEDGTVSVTNLLTEMSDALVKAQGFAADIQTLRGLKLNDTTLQQLLAAGPEAAAATAAAIVSGGQSAVDQINYLADQLDTAGTSLGNTMSSQFYDAGIQAAAGLLKGLQSQAAALDAQATALGTSIANAIKKALGIHSPSKVLEGVGAETTAGLVKGLDADAVATAGTQMASALVSAFGQPNLSADAVYGVSGGTTITVKLTAEQVSQLERGRAISLDLDAFRAAGGRSRA